MPNDDSSVRDALNHQSLHRGRSALSTARPGSLVQLDEITLD